jgi:hypothetical protein
MQKQVLIESFGPVFLRARESSPGGSSEIDSVKPITILRKRAKLGDHGFPRATIAFYGPADKKATKAVLGIFLREGDEIIAHPK